MSSLQRVPIIALEETTVAGLLEMAREHNVSVNKTYQRSKVWKAKQRDELVRSIMRGYCIGLFTFKEKDNGREWEVLDGQQRLHTLFWFKSEKLNDDVGNAPAFTVDGKSYQSIQRRANTRNRFDNAPAVYLLLNSRLGDEETAKYFTALQEGVPLNAAERLSAMPGMLRNYISDYADKMPLISENAVCKQYRFKRRYLLSQVLKLEKDTRWGVKSPEFPDYREKNLRGVYKEYKEDDPAKKAEVEKILLRIQRNLATIKVAMRGNEKRVNPHGYFITIYLLVSFLERKRCAYNLEKFGKMISDFWLRMRADKGKDEIKFKEWISEGTKEGALNNKFKILKRRFFKTFGRRLIKKDKHRAFAEKQKAKICLRAKGECFLKDEEYCPGSIVSDAEAVYHHIKKYSRGGKTNLKNGALCHKDCHDKFHANEGPDTEEQKRSMSLREALF